jgi:DNA-binding transcriptional regulator/RsmH inhibitor MraZ
LGQEVFLAGTLNCFEIWDKGRWDKQMELNRENHQEIMETMATMGL